MGKPLNDLPYNVEEGARRGTMRSDTNFTNHTNDPTEVRKDTKRRTMKTSIRVIRAQTWLAGILILLSCVDVIVVEEEVLCCVSVEVVVEVAAVVVVVVVVVVVIATVELLSESAPSTAFTFGSLTSTNG